MSHKPQLPVEVVDKIEEEGERYADKYLNGVVNTREHAHLTEAYTAGATAYATKLQVLEYDNNQLKGELEGYKKAREELQHQNDKMKAMATGWRPLLEEVLRDDNEYGELPIELIDKIKKFLYGE